MKYAFATVLLLLSAWSLFHVQGQSRTQDISGTWQGVIRNPGDSRQVIRISKDGSALRAVLFSIDEQPGQSFPAPSVTRQGAVIRMQFPGIGAAYHGTLSADGNSIAGSFVQNGVALTLNLARTNAQNTWEIPGTAAPEKPMAADANPSFEVASVRQTPPDILGSGLGPSPGGRFTVHNMTLKSLMLFAYGLNPNQLEDDPGWFDADRFDIVAKADTTGAPNKEQQLTMLRKLLADRLSLRFHREKKERTVYVLKVLPSGARLTPSTGDPACRPTASGSGGGGHRHFTATDMNMDEFTSGLTSNVDGPVIDRTGLSGCFDITLDWRSGDLAPGNAASGSAAAFPDIFTALRDQLGLKLDATKAKIDVFVIDHVEKPSEN